MMKAIADVGDRRLDTEQAVDAVLGRAVVADVAQVHRHTSGIGELATLPLLLVADRLF